MAFFSWVEFFVRFGCVLFAWGLAYIFSYTLRKFFGFEFSQPVKALLVPFVMITSFSICSLFGF
jgi:hypothetical protein